MTDTDISRQLRPILKRFKRMADGGLVDDIEAVARHFDISPRRQTGRGRDFVMWRPCRLGSIAGAFDVVLNMERNGDVHAMLIVLPKFRVAAPPEAMLGQLSKVFGGASIRTTRKPAREAGSSTVQQQYRTANSS